MDDATSAFMDGFSQWLERPFDPQMSALNWFLFFGLLLLISFAWGFIIRKVVD